jgi:hypothetical protein
MKRVAPKRLTVLFASLLVIAAYLPGQAATMPIDFLSTNTFHTEDVLTFGDYDFDLYNATHGWVLNGFYTMENGKWSKNWLTTKLAPSKSFHMMWSSASDSGDCEVPFKTTWDDYDKPEIHKVDWCKGIKAIYLKDDDISISYK